MSTFQICLPLWLIVMWLWIINDRLGEIHKTLKLDTQKGLTNR